MWFDIFFKKHVCVSLFRFNFPEKYEVIVSITITLLPVNLI